MLFDGVRIMSLAEQYPGPLATAILGLSTIGKNPSLGSYHLLTGPLVALPSCLGLQREPDPRFADVINAWIDFNRGTGQIREWLLEGLTKVFWPEASSTVQAQPEPSLPVDARVIVVEAEPGSCSVDL